MRRREFIAGLGTSALLPTIVPAQQVQSRVVGFLYSESLAAAQEVLAPFRRGLIEAGFVEGRNVAIVSRVADGNYDRVEELAAELIRQPVDVIFENLTRALLATKAMTQTIPIVFVTGTDPVESGLVASLNRPGGNVTGISLLGSELIPKRLEVLHEAVPSAAKVAFLVNSTNPVSTEVQIREVRSAARALGLDVIILSAASRDEIETAFRALVSAGAGAFLVSNDSTFRTFRHEFIALAQRHAIPGIYAFRENVEAGGLMSYAADLSAAYRQLGAYVGRILKGENPANLPVQQVTKFELAVNLKTAKALGLTIPETLLATADEVIQ